MHFYVCNRVDVNKTASSWRFAIVMQSPARNVCSRNCDTPRRCAAGAAAITLALVAHVVAAAYARSFLTSAHARVCVQIAPALEQNARARANVSAVSKSVSLYARARSLALTYDFSSRALVCRLLTLVIVGVPCWRERADASVCAHTRACAHARDEHDESINTTVRSLTWRRRWRRRRVWRRWRRRGPSRRAIFGGGGGVLSNQPNCAPILRPFFYESSLPSRGGGVGWPRARAIRRRAFAFAPRRCRCHLRCRDSSERRRGARMWTRANRARARMFTPAGCAQLNSFSAARRPRSLSRAASREGARLQTRR